MKKISVEIADPKATPQERKAILKDAFHKKRQAKKRDRKKGKAQF